MLVSLFLSKNLRKFSPFVQQSQAAFTTITKVDAAGNTHHLKIPDLTPEEKAKMEKPNTCTRKSIKVDLKKGEKYYYCACGLSKNQPFCDGSHKGTKFTPIAFEVEEDMRKGICACKRTKNEKGFCDGTHKNDDLDWQADPLDHPSSFTSRGRNTQLEFRL